MFAVVLQHYFSSFLSFLNILFVKHVKHIQMNMRIRLQGSRKQNFQNLKWDRLQKILMEMSFAHHFYLSLALC